MGFSLVMTVVIQLVTMIDRSSYQLRLSSERVAAVINCWQSVAANG